MKPFSERRLFSVLPIPTKPDARALHCRSELD
jgi:hypothetical protein